LDIKLYRYSEDVDLKVYKIMTNFGFSREFWPFHLKPTFFAKVVLQSVKSVKKLFIFRKNGRSGSSRNSSIPNWRHESENSRGKCLLQ